MGVETIPLPPEGYGGSFSEIVYDTGEPLEGEPLEFRLIYSGDQLFSNGTAAQKHAIRRVFHPQLKQLWESNSQLRGLAASRGTYDLPVGTDHTSDGCEELARAAYFNRLGNLYERGKFRFAPLVLQEICLRVSLDILFLRRDQHPLIMGGGDIDNRLKTLFDALRVPSTNDGLEVPEDGEEPFFVLLQDDCLISEIRVDTDNILLLPNSAKANSRDVFLVIHVKLMPTERVAHSWAFA